MSKTIPNNNIPASYYKIKRYTNNRQKSNGDNNDHQYMPSYSRLDEGSVNIGNSISRSNAIMPDSRANVEPLPAASGDNESIQSLPEPNTPSDAVQYFDEPPRQLRHPFLRTIDGCLRRIRAVNSFFTVQTKAFFLVILLVFVLWTLISTFFTALSYILLLLPVVISLSTFWWSKYRHVYSFNSLVSDFAGGFFKYGLIAFLIQSAILTITLLVFMRDIFTAPSGGDSSEFTPRDDVVPIFFSFSAALWKSLTLFAVWSIIFAITDEGLKYKMILDNRRAARQQQGTVDFESTIQTQQHQQREAGQLRRNRATNERRMSLARIVHRSRSHMDTISSPPQDDTKTSNQGTQKDRHTTRPPISLEEITTHEEGVRRGNDEILSPKNKKTDVSTMHSDKEAQGLSTAYRGKRLIDNDRTMIGDIYDEKDTDYDDIQPRKKKYSDKISASQLPANYNGQSRTFYNASYGMDVNEDNIHHHNPSSYEKSIDELPIYHSEREDPLTTPRPNDLGGRTGKYRDYKPTSPNEDNLFYGNDNTSIHVTYKPSVILEQAHQKSSQMKLPSSPNSPDTWVKGEQKTDEIYNSRSDHIDNVNCETSKQSGVSIEDTSSDSKIPEKPAPILESEKGSSVVTTNTSPIVKINRNQTAALAQLVSRLGNTHKGPEEVTPAVNKGYYKQICSTERRDGNNSIEEITDSPQIIVDTSPGVKLSNVDDRTADNNRFNMNQLTPSSHHCESLSQNDHHRQLYIQSIDIEESTVKVKRFLSFISSLCGFTLTLGVFRMMAVSLLLAVHFNRFDTARLIAILSLVQLVFVYPIDLLCGYITGLKITLRDEYNSEYYKGLSPLRCVYVSVLTKMAYAFHLLCSLGLIYTSNVVITLSALLLIPFILCAILLIIHAIYIERLLPLSYLMTNHSLLYYDRLDDGSGHDIDDDVNLLEGTENGAGRQHSSPSSVNNIMIPYTSDPYHDSQITKSGDYIDRTKYSASYNKASDPLTLDALSPNISNGIGLNGTASSTHMMPIITTSYQSTCKQYDTDDENNDVVIEMTNMNPQENSQTGRITSKDTNRPQKSHDQSMVLSEAQNNHIKMNGDDRNISIPPTQYGYEVIGPHENGLTSSTKPIEHSTLLSPGSPMLTQEADKLDQYFRWTGRHYKHDLGAIAEYTGDEYHPFTLDDEEMGDNAFVDNYYQGNQQYEDQIRQHQDYRPLTQEYRVNTSSPYKANTEEPQDKYEMNNNAHNSELRLLDQKRESGVNMHISALDNDDEEDDTDDHLYTGINVKNPFKYHSYQLDADVENMELETKDIDHYLQQDDMIDDRNQSKHEVQVEMNGSSEGNASDGATMISKSPIEYKASTTGNEEVKEDRRDSKHDNKDDTRQYSSTAQKSDSRSNRKRKKRRSK